MTKFAYVWGDGDPMPIFIANEFSANKLNYQFRDVVYDDNLFMHKRIETGFYAQRVFGGGGIGKKNKIFRVLGFCCYFVTLY